MINTLQLAARKNLIQMSSDVINYGWLQKKKILSDFIKFL
jgi:hypothetical protein